jgi:ketosteroid isomerase-like protein
MTTNNTITDPKIETVKRLYDAFFQGDADAFVADVADDVDWAAEAASSSAPWYGRRDKAGARQFFADIGANVEVSQFEQLSYAANDTDVFVAVRWTFTVRATGKAATMYMQHWFRFAGGKIVFFRGSEDSEQTAAAFAVV